PPRVETCQRAPVAGNGSTKTSGLPDSSDMYASHRPSGENSDCHNVLRTALRTFHGFCPGARGTIQRPFLGMVTERNCPSRDQFSTSASPGDGVTGCSASVLSTVFVKR